MIPGPALMGAALLWAALGLLAFLFPWAVPWWAGFGSLTALVALADALVLRAGTARIYATRSVPEALPLGEPASVVLSLGLESAGWAPARVEAFDLVPDCFEWTGLPLSVPGRALSRDEPVTLSYSIQTLTRGSWTFPGVDLRSRTVLGFWKLRTRLPLASSGRTFPNFRALARLADAELRGVTDAVGLHSRRKRGLGTEFLDLRDYRPGDPVRSIDWKATSRRRKPIVREYQEERDQEIVFLVDSGYRLHRADGDMLLFDRALDALLYLAYVAAKRDDSIAVMSFGNDERWLPPRRGHGSMPALLNTIYDLQSGPGASSPADALEKLVRRLRKRSLIILLSNLQEEDGQALSWILPTVTERHLLLVVNIREEELAAASSRSGDATPLVRAAAFSYSQRRKALAARWERLGILTLETTASKLSPDLVNSYLDIKRSGRL
ncbi:MAG: DUF58 domain-containing protein [Spirochaetia bacterium]|nr:DUF58 domain-containing protein [Spirochaetia bacterium]